jgi:hypothetical protein
MRAASMDGSMRAHARTRYACARSRAHITGAIARRVPAGLICAVEPRALWRLRVVHARGRGALLCRPPRAERSHDAHLRIHARHGAVLRVGCVCVLRAVFCVLTTSRSPIMIECWRHGRFPLPVCARRPHVGRRRRRSARGVLCSRQRMLLGTAGTRWYTHAYLDAHTAVVSGSGGFASFFDLRSQQELKVKRSAVRPAQHGEVMRGSSHGAPMRHGVSG